MIGKLGSPMLVPGLESILEVWCRIISGGEPALSDSAGQKNFLAGMVQAGVCRVLRKSLQRLDIVFLPFYSCRFVLQGTRLMARFVKADTKDETELQWGKMVFGELASLLPELMIVAARGRVVVERITALSAIGELTRFPFAISGQQLTSIVASLSVLLRFKPEHFQRELQLQSNMQSYQAMLLGRGAWDEKACAKMVDDVITLAKREAVGIMLLIIETYLAKDLETQLVRDFDQFQVASYLLKLCEYCQDPVTLKFMGWVFHDLCHGSLSNLLGTPSSPSLVMTLAALYKEPYRAELAGVPSTFAHLCGVSECSRGPVRVGSWFAQQ
ncbi:unnamed protein product, partial [Polarella glacialis]